MTGNNPNLELVNINAYIKFGEILSVCSQNIKPKRNSDIYQGRNSVTNMPKMMHNNLMAGPVNTKTYIKFGEILSICSHGIEHKRKSDINQGP